MIAINKKLLFIMLISFSLQMFNSCSLINNNEISIHSIEKAMDNEDFNKMVDMCDQLLENDSLNHQLLYYKGVGLTSLWELTLAEENLNKALKLDSQNTIYYSALGFLMIRKGDLEKSIEFSKMALKLDSDNFDARLNMIESELNQGKLKKALEHSQHALILIDDIRENKYKSMLHLHRAEIFIKQKEFEKTINEAKQSIKYDGKAVYPKIILAQAKARLGNLEEALKIIEEAIKLDPNNPFSLSARGVILVVQGKKQKGCEELNRARMIVEKNPIQYLQLNIENILDAFCLGKN